MAKREKKPKSKTRIIIERILTGITLVLLGFVGLSLLTGMIFKKNNVPMMLPTPPVSIVPPMIDEAMAFISIPIAWLAAPEPT